MLKSRSRRLLEVLTLRCRFHLNTQVVQQFTVAPFQKLTYLRNDVMVVLFRLIAGAGSHASFDLEFNTSSFSLAVYEDRTSG